LAFMKSNMRPFILGIVMLLWVPSVFRFSCLSLVFLSFFFCTQAQAVVVSEEVFEANGGDLNDIAGTITDANDALREMSKSEPFYAVGWIGWCTATWLGDDGEWAYVLTAAHCTNDNALEHTMTVSFEDYRGQVIATGTTTAHIHPYRIDPPAGHGGASTDVAVLKIPKVSDIKDPFGAPIAQPVLYDGSQELNGKVEFAGYGLWGAGTDANSAYNPASGKRRMWGENLISSIFESEHGIGSIYVPTGSTDEAPNRQWARVASGDSGSAWWQDHLGHKVIIATTNGGHATLSTGARVSKYVEWIRTIYPDAQVLSEQALYPQYLARTGTEPPGANCTHGGTFLETGLDTNFSEVLDDDEVTSIEYICHGSDGANGADGQAGADGADGADGQAGSDGADGSDGQNGSDGADGSDGQNGNDGNSALIETQEATADDGCSAGGQVVWMGVDQNANGVLDPDEANDSVVLCNPEPVEGSGCSSTNQGPSGLLWLLVLLAGLRRLKSSAEKSALGID
jgi:hypothetical protein